MKQIYSSTSMIVSILMTSAVLMGSSSAHFLNTEFYKTTCPNVFRTVQSGVRSALAGDKRMGASLLRLHFHDCFVQGCDASLLLNDTASFQGEQTAIPNGGIRGLNVIEDIKSQVEAVCPGVVSCADILAIAARDSVAILGGPTWQVKVGRRDSRTASFATANGGAIPLSSFDLPNLITRFAEVGLSAKDMVALSGSHTIGQARCVTFRGRIYSETNIDPAFARTRQANCPSSNQGSTNLAPLDLRTPTFWDNSYFVNLISNRGLLHSDQVLYNGNSTDALVKTYSKSTKTFNYDFVAAMIRMADISPLVGSRGEIRKICARVN